MQTPASLPSQDLGKAEPQSGLLSRGAPGPPFCPCLPGTELFVGILALKVIEHKGLQLAFAPATLTLSGLAGGFWLFVPAFGVQCSWGDRCGKGRRDRASAQSEMQTVPCDLGYSGLTPVFGVCSVQLALSREVVRRSLS
jgi:hypothetical protein